MPTHEEDYRAGAVELESHVNSTAMVREQVVGQRDAPDSRQDLPDDQIFASGTDSEGADSLEKADRRRPERITVPKLAENQFEDTAKAERAKGREAVISSEEDRKTLDVTWDSELDSGNPKGMTKARKWSIVFILSAGSCCVYVQQSPISLPVIQHFCFEECG